MSFTRSTMSLDEATVLRRSGFTVTTIRKPCSPRAMFEFEDSPASRALLEKFSRGECLHIPEKLLLITRADLYREARSARGGL